jgi:transcriptional regulator with GAF, ATPase, and Fis domain
MIKEETEITVPKDIQENWQEIVNILAQFCEVPAALIMMLSDADIEVFISSQSKGNPYHPGDKEHFEDSGLYCETVIKSKNKLLVPDAFADEHWKNNPDIKLGMVSYLGFPIFWPNNKPFGTICVLDVKRNKYSAVIEQLMLKFKDTIESHLELIYVNHILGDKNRQLSDYLMEIQALRGLVSICSNCKSIRDNQGVWHPIEHYLINHPEADFTHALCPKCIKDLYPSFDGGS